ncbi:hypothetical protein CHS0354_031086 [Potamilus streckersoni]|uniref:Uncharacterized protein n=1 Tax=Potamilus streckersoni TaxID=2493646 RepID=A0AAE0VN03_9BIVA|nr:hypothetical protein CHS0354_031086 [Potamilus streckersoni]
MCSPLLTLPVVIIDRITGHKGAFQIRRNVFTYQQTKRPIMWIKHVKGCHQSKVYGDCVATFDHALSAGEVRQRRHPPCAEHCGENLCFIEPPLWHQARLQIITRALVAVRPLAVVKVAIKCELGSRKCCATVYMLDDRSEILGQLSIYCILGGGSRLEDLQTVSEDTLLSPKDILGLDCHTLWNMRKRRLLRIGSQSNLKFGFIQMRMATYYVDLIHPAHQKLKIEVCRGLLHTAFSSTTKKGKEIGAKLCEDAYMCLEEFRQIPKYLKRPANGFLDFWISPHDVLQLQAEALRRLFHDSALVVDLDCFLYRKKTAYVLSG